jgi:hypothetical protein
MRLAPSRWTGFSDRHDHMSTAAVSIDLPSTPRAPRATRRGLHHVREVCGSGSDTAEPDATVVANDVMTSAVEHGAAEHARPE